MTNRHATMMVWSVTSDGESNRLKISEEVAVYKLENLNKQLQAVADTGSEEDRVYSEMAENMANNMHEFNTVVGNVALNSSDNMHKAAVSMADSMGKNSINAQTSNKICCFICLEYNKITV